MKIFLLALFLIFAPLVLLASPNSSLYFEPQSPQAQVNASFSTKLKINPSANKVTAIELYLSFDKAKLSLNSLTPSSNLGVVLQAASINNTTGQASIILGASPTSPVTSVSDVVTLNFTAKAQGTANVSVLNTTRAVAIGETGNVVTSYGQANANIGSAGSSLQPSPSSGPAPSQAPSPARSPRPSVAPPRTPSPTSSPGGTNQTVEKYFEKLIEFVKNNPLASKTYEPEPIDQSQNIFIVFAQYFFDALKGIWGRIFR